MSRLRLLVVALMAVFAVAAMASASASALILPLVLPKQATWTGESLGVAELTSLSGVIKCQKATAEGTEEVSETSSLGLFHIDFKECKTEVIGIKVACNSKGDAKEVILNLGQWHLVYDKFSEKENDTEANLGVAILFLPEHTVIECAGNKIEVLGSVLCLILEYKTSSTKKAFHCIKSSTNAEQASEKTWFNKEDKLKNNGTAALLCAFNGGEEQECSENALGDVITPKAVVIDG